jgi:tetratricopeptide (TPR) repeat protein
MNLKNKKAIMLLISFSLLGAFLILYSSGCSTTGSIRWGKLGGASEDSDLSQFFAGIRRAPGNPDSHFLLGSYYQERGQHREAIQEFKKVIAIEPAHVKAYNAIGVSCDLLGFFAQAIVAYEAGLHRDPTAAYLHNNIGYSYLLQGDLDKAIVAFAKAIALNGQDGRFHNNLGLAYGEKGQYDLALKEFKLAGDESRAYFNMAQVYYKKGLFSEARRHYTAALTSNPSSTIVRTGLEAARALASIFQPDKKKAKVQDFVAPEPFSPKESLDEEFEEAVPSRPETVNVAEEIPDASPSVTLAETKLAETQVPIEEKTIPRDAAIEISNGNGVNGMAARVGGYLKEKGLRVVRLTNADNFKHKETRVFFQKGYDQMADHVAGELPAIQNKEERKKLDRPNIKVKVLIGKDLIPYGKMFAAQEGS